MAYIQPLVLCLTLSVIGNFMVYAQTCTESWVESPNKQGTGGTVQSTITTLADCQAGCTASSTCVAMDFNPTALDALRCFFQEQVGSTTDQNGVNHYEFQQSCTDAASNVCKFLFYGEYEFDGTFTTIPGATTLQGCLIECMAVTNCKTVTFFTDTTQNPVANICRSVTGTATGSSRRRKDKSFQYEKDTCTIATTAAPPTTTTGPPTTTTAPPTTTTTTAPPTTTTTAPPTTTTTAPPTTTTTTSAPPTTTLTTTTSAPLTTSTITTTTSAPATTSTAPPTTTTSSAPPTTSTSGATTTSDTTTSGTTTFTLSTTTTGSTTTPANCGPDKYPVWTKKENYHALQGLPQASSVNTLEKCQASCLANIDCRGIDFVRSASTSTTSVCYIHVQSKLGNVLPEAGTDFYDLTMRCGVSTVAKCTFTWGTSENMHGLKGYPINANSVSDCRAECLRTAGCHSIDTDPRGGVFCYIFRNGDATTEPLTGVTHHVFTSSCPTTSSASSIGTTPSTTTSASTLSTTTSTTASTTTTSGAPTTTTSGAPTTTTGATSTSSPPPNTSSPAPTTTTAASTTTSGPAGTTTPPPTTTSPAPTTTLPVSTTPPPPVSTSLPIVVTTTPPPAGTTSPPPVFTTTANCYPVWQKTIGQGANGGIAQTDVTTEDDCLAKCAGNVRCVAVDFNAASSSKCWHHIDSVGASKVDSAVTHYLLINRCGTTIAPGSTTIVPGSTTFVPGSTTFVPGTTTVFSTTPPPTAVPTTVFSTQGPPPSTTPLPGTTSQAPGSSSPRPVSSTLRPSSPATPRSTTIIPASTPAPTTPQPAPSSPATPRSTTFIPASSPSSPAPTTPQPAPSSPATPRSTTIIPASSPSTPVPTTPQPPPSSPATPRSTTIIPASSPATPVPTTPGPAPSSPATPRSSTVPAPTSPPVTLPPLSSTTSCPEGFTSFVNTGIDNGIFQTSISSIAACQDGCMKDAQCYAFDVTSNLLVGAGILCWHHVSNNANQNQPVSKSGVTLYMKGCACEPTWVDSPLVSYFNGKPEPVTTVEACQNRCVAESQCLGIDIDRTGTSAYCWLHLKAENFNDENIKIQSDVTHFRLTRCNTPTVIPTPTSASTTPVSSVAPVSVCHMYELVDHNDNGGNNIGSMKTKAECQKACAASDTCIAAEYTRSSTECYLHTVVNKRSRNTCCVRFEKLCNQTTCTDFMTEYANSRGTGGSQLPVTVNTEGSCISECYKMSTCTGVQWNKVASRCVMFTGSFGKTIVDPNFTSFVRNKCVQTVVGTTTAPPSTTAPQPGTCIADIAFLIDNSGSVEDLKWANQTLTNFNLTQKLLRDVIGAINIGPITSKVALVPFSTFSQVIFKFDQSTSFSAVNESINNMKYGGGKTNIPSALGQLVNDVFKPENGDRPGVKNIIVLIVDGPTSDDYIRQLNNSVLALRSLGDVPILVVAVTDQVDFKELEMITGRNTFENVLTAQYYMTLDGAFIADSLKKVCDGQTVTEVTPALTRPTPVPTALP